MANAGESKFKLSNVEPISAVCLVVLLIAGVIVLGIYVNDHYLGDDDETVEFGDSVTIDYTGSLYDFYNKDTTSGTPVIFDTTLSKVGNNSSYLFTSSFSKTSYESSTITLGNYSYLKAFENAIIGHDVGDTIYVKLSADKNEGYNTGNSNYYCKTLSADLVASMTLSDFNEAFGTSYSDAFTNVSVKDSSSIPATATYSGSGNVTVTYGVAVDDTYTVSDNALGKVTIKITDVQDDAISYTVSVANPIDTKNVITDQDGSNSASEIEMITVSVFGETYSIVGTVDDTSNDAVMFTKATGTALLSQKDLYFVITIKSLN